MNRKSRELTSSERALWRRVASSVKRVRPDGDDPAEHTPELAEHAPTAARHQRTEAAAKAGRGRPAAAEGAKPADRGGELRVRRGRVEIDGVIDLHGLRYDQAKAALAAFLLQAHSDGARLTLVITGKGREGAGVIRQGLPEWLGDPAVRAVVAGFAGAHARHGGAGAYYVFLRARR